MVNDDNQLGEPEKYSNEVITVGHKTLTVALTGKYICYLHETCEFKLIRKNV
jgi:hypothetical protein